MLRRPAALSALATALALPACAPARAVAPPPASGADAVTPPDDEAAATSSSDVDAATTSSSDVDAATTPRHVLRLQALAIGITRLGRGPNGRR
jgi:hypothetical protein